MPTAPSATAPSTPVTMRVDCATVSSFLKEYARCVTEGGLFLRTRELQPVGTRLSFIVELSNGQRLLGGTGIVHWSRGGGATPFERPRVPGMGLRFAELDAESRQLVGLIVATQPEGARDPEPPGPHIAELLAAGGAGAQPMHAPDPAQGAPPAFAVGSGLPAEAEPSPLLPEVPRIAPLIAPLLTPLIDVPRIAPLLEAEAFAALRSGASAPRPPRPSGPPGLTARTEAGAAKPAGAPRPARRTPVPFSTPAPQAPPAAAMPSAAREPAPREETLPRQAPVAPRHESPAVPTAPARPAAPSRDAPREEPLPPPAPRAEAALPPPSAAASPPAAVPLPPRAPEASRSVPEREQGAQRVTRAIEALRRQEYAKAEAELQLAVAHEPGSARYRFELGLVYFEWSDDKTLNHDGAAEACFARAADLDPGFDQPLVYLGQVQLRRRLLGEAEASFREALRRQPHCRGAQEGLSLIAAMRWKQRGLRTLAAAAVLVLVLGGVLLRPAARSPAPVAALPAAPAQQVARATPVPTAPGPPAPTPSAPSTPVPATPAPGAVSAAPAQEAAAVLVASAAPESPAPRDTAAPAAERPRLEPPRRAVRRARPEPARAAAAQPAAATGASGSGSAASLVKAGDAALRAGKADEALAAFTQAIKSTPAFAPAHRGLGSVYMMQGNDAQAAAAYRAYLRLAPGAPDAGRIQALLSGLE